MKRKSELSGFLYDIPYIFWLGIILELLTIYFFFQPSILSGRLIFILLALHCSANILMAYGQKRILEKTIEIGIGGYFLLFNLGLFMPLGGSIGLMPLTYSLKQINKEKEEISVHETTQPAPLPESPQNIEGKTTISAHGMKSRLLHMFNSDEHLNIVLATRFMRDEYGIPLLTSALRNPADDVRLLAFSLLEEKSGVLHSRIEKMRQSLESDGDNPKTNIIMARDYLSLITLGLVQDEMKEQVLTKAEHHVLAAMDKSSGDRNAHFIYGQILLAKGDVGLAEQALLKALSLGFSPTDIHSLLAEIDYLRKKFITIPELLRKIPESRRSFPPLAHVTHFWESDSPDSSTA